MNARILLAVAARVLTQLRRDHRTLAMLLHFTAHTLLAATFSSQCFAH